MDRIHEISNMAKILNWVTIEKQLRAKGFILFSPRDLVRLFGVSPVAANFFVFRNTRRGLLIRLKKSPKGSLYRLANQSLSPYVIANRLYEPSYISLDSALSFHRLIPESLYTVTSVTVKATRMFQVENVAYSYQKLKREAYQGYRPVLENQMTILIAEPEKALADLLYFVSIGKRRLHYERIELKKINRSKLERYLKLYAQPRMIDLAKGLYAKQR